MKYSILLAGLFMSLQVFALECPVDFGQDDYLEKVATAITETDSCYAGAEVAKACALGASGDNYTVPYAIAKCEGDFEKELSQKDQSTYADLKGKCTKKYENMSGTMYISARAFCHLSVAELFSELFTTAQ